MMSAKYCKTAHIILTDNAELSDIFNGRLKEFQACGPVLPKCFDGCPNFEYTKKKKGI